MTEANQIMDVEASKGNLGARVAQMISVADSIISGQKPIVTNVNIEEFFDLVEDCVVLRSREREQLNIPAISNIADAYAKIVRYYSQHHL